MKHPAFLKAALLTTTLLSGFSVTADPVLTISDGTTSVGPVTLTGGSGYQSVALDSSWILVVVAGESKPLVGSAANPNMEMTIQAISLGSAPPLTITLSDNNFGPTSGNNNVVSDLTGHAAAGTGDTITYNTYYDSGNTLGALTTLLTGSGSLLPAGSSAIYDSTLSGTLSLSGPYSLSQVVQIDGGEAATYSLSVNLQGTNQNVTPSLSLIKTASPTNALPGQSVTYSYAVTNTGSVTISNINIVDDNGTPNNTNDDFVVNAMPFSLDPGQGTSVQISHISEPMCVTSSATNFNAGMLTVNVLPNGNVEVYYLQSQGLNDNRYGTNATAATGWSGGHKFSDLTGSDEATFLFTDGNGKQVLKFQEDYISATTSAKFGDGVTITYPSGYGTLGPLGGDGKMLIGSSSNVLSCHTTLSDSLNQPGFTTFTVNSPPETSPLSNVSIPPGWDYTDGYYVLISSNAFGAAGFGTVSIPLVHNSPSKNKLDQTAPTNVCDCVVNTAYAVGVVAGGIPTVYSDPNGTQAQVCFANSSSPGSGCNLSFGKIAIGPAGFQVPIKNSGTTTVYMTELDLNQWPSVNGNLTKITLNGAAAVWQGSVSQPASLTTTDFNNTSSNTTQRSIPPGKTFNLTLQFQHAANNTLSNYGGGTVKFGTNSSCVINFLP